MDGWMDDETERTERVASASAPASSSSSSFFSFAPVAVAVVAAANDARLVKRNRRHGHPSSIDTPRDTTRDANTHEWVSTTDEGWDGDVV